MHRFITKEVPEMLRIWNKTTPRVFSAPKQSVECGSEKLGKQLEIPSFWQGKLKIQRFGSRKRDDSNSFWPAKSVVLKMSEERVSALCYRFLNVRFLILNWHTNIKSFVFLSWTPFYDNIKFVTKLRIENWVCIVTKCLAISLVNVKKKYCCIDHWENMIALDFWPSFSLFYFLF